MRARTTSVFWPCCKEKERHLELVEDQQGRRSALLGLILCHRDIRREKTSAEDSVARAAQEKQVCGAGNPYWPETLVWLPKRCWSDGRERQTPRN